MAEDGKVIFRYIGDTSGIDSANAEAEQKVGGLGSRLGGIAAKAVAAIGAAAVAAGTAVVKLGSDFEATVSGIKAVSGASDEEMEQLREAALQAGADTVFSASESAKAIEELIKAGVSTEQILNGGLTGALDLAAAGELDLASSAEIASTVLNAFRDDNLSVADAANILAGAANASATDVAGMSQGLSQVSAVAAGMGMSFEDTATALAVFAQNGMQGSDSGTSLKTMLMSLQPSTEKQIEQFKELGLYTEEAGSAFYDAEGHMRPLNEISGLLQTSMAGMTDAERAMALEVMFGSDALRAANILYREGADGVDAMNAAMLNVTAADVAAERMNNLKGSVETLMGSLETIAVGLYEQMQEPLKETIGALDEALQNLSESGLLDELGNSLGDIATSLGGALIDLLPVLVELINAILPPLMDVVDVLLPPLLDLITTLTPILSDIIDTLLPPLVELFGALLPPLLELVDALLPPLLEIFDALIEPLLDLIDVLLPPLVSLLESLGPLVEALSPEFKELADITAGVLSGALEALSPIIDTLMGVLEGLLEFIAGAFTGDWETAWDGVVKIFKGIINLLPAAIEGAVNGAISVINGLIKGVNKITGAIGIDAIPIIKKVSIPRFRTGLDFVPEDEFPALLHRGEAVLTADEADLWRGLGGASGIAAAITDPPSSSNNSSVVINQLEVYPDSTEYARILALLEKSDRARQDERAGVQ